MLWASEMCSRAAAFESCFSQLRPRLDTTASRTAASPSALPVYRWRDEAMDWTALSPHGCSVKPVNTCKHGGGPDLGN
eukprot:102023-Alexandrium_andersonii.AAC.1